MTTPEARARQEIDAKLAAAGWAVQDAPGVNLYAGSGVAVREFPLQPGHGSADYLLYAEQKAVGVVEAKKVGDTLTGVERQSEKYSTGLPDELPAPVRPLPFLYESTGVETRFTNGLDPEPRSRGVFSFHRPEQLAEWLGLRPSVTTRRTIAESPHGYATPSTLRDNLQDLPPLDASGLWPAQAIAVTNLEESLKQDRPRALIQMATGSGKTFTAITSIYRLIKHGGARRVLFLVDRANLGRQALREFQGYVTPDGGRKFTELYNVQHLTSGHIDPASRVVISTIQRLYSILQGTELAEDADESSAAALAPSQPQPVSYNPDIPVETFDVIFTDEAHRSIYNLWRQVLEYFDAHLIGLTATPSKQTLGFFNQNLVMEYNHSQAVVDHVNVDYDVYRIRTQITEQGSTVEAGHYVDRRNRQTRDVRWEQLDQDLDYGASVLDRDVVAMDQIRTVIRTFRDRLPTEIFPGRTQVPKTLIYAKDDSHADDIVQVVREEFGRGNDFAEKITYRTGTVRETETFTDDDGVEQQRHVYRSTGVRAEDRLQAFRNSFNPRIAVTVDMIATGTDIKPLEIVMFMRSVKSRNFFEQMKGRGVRIIDPTDLQAVTPDAANKDRFVIIDCVGVCESEELNDSLPLEREPTVSLEKLLDFIARGSTDINVVSSLAGRIARLDRRLHDRVKERLSELVEGHALSDLSHRLTEAIDPDKHIERARAVHGLDEDEEPSEQQIALAASELVGEAVRPIAASPQFRNELANARRDLEQTIDTISQDQVLEVGYSQAALERAKALTESFEEYIEENRDEITALQIIYNQPLGRKVKFSDLRELADAIKLPPRNWSPEALWQAYEALDDARGVRTGGGRLLADLVGLVRYAIHRSDELVPAADVVDERFDTWLTQQQTLGREFSDEQMWWLREIKNHVAASMGVTPDDFEYSPFNQRGGLGRAQQVFDGGAVDLLNELNEVLVG